MKNAQLITTTSLTLYCFKASETTRINYCHSLWTQMIQNHSTVGLSARWRTLLCSQFSDTTELRLQGLPVIHRHVSAPGKPAPVRSASERRDRLPDNDVGQSVSHRARDAASRLWNWIWTGNQSRRQGTYVRKIQAQLKHVVKLLQLDFGLSFSDQLTWAYQAG